MSFQVWKIGGSLFSLADLPHRIIDLFKRECPALVVLIAGGGPKVRELELKGVTESPAKEHWESINIMRENALNLANYLPSFKFVTKWPEKGITQAILDPLEFCKNDLDPLGQFILPENRIVRSDSIALRFALAHNADRLVLGKSISSQSNMRNEKFVDPYFHSLLRKNSGKVCVETINLRELPLPEIRQFVL